MNAVKIFAVGTADKFPAIPAKLSKLIPLNITTPFVKILTARSKVVLRKVCTLWRRSFGLENCHKGAGNLEDVLRIRMLEFWRTACVGFTYKSIRDRTAAPLAHVFMFGNTVVHGNAACCYMHAPRSIYEVTMLPRRQCYCIAMQHGTR